MVSNRLISRIAAVVTFLYALGHMSGYPWTPAEAHDALAVVEGMRRVHFEVAGSQRSYWDFYFGFGLISGAFLFVQAAVMWCVGAVVQREPGFARAIACIFMLGFALNTYFCQRFFFLPPMSFAAVITALMGLLVWRARSGAHLPTAPLAVAA